MNPFFAMVWDVSDSRSQRTAALLRQCIDRSVTTELKRAVTTGFALYDLSSLDRPTRIDGRIDFSAEAGVVVFGAVFERSDALTNGSEPRRLTDQALRNLRDSHGASATKDLWGSYIVFSRRDGDVAIVTDPTSGIPCFYTEYHGVTLIFSNLEVCDFIDRRKFQVNERFISALIAYDKIQCGETGLTNVRELLGGQRLRVTRNGLSIDSLWDPRKIAQQTYAGSMKNAADELRETTIGVVRRWASQYSSIVLDLSGGLDSSIVLGCLERAGLSEKVTAVHHRADSHDTAELDYARLAADFTNTKFRTIKFKPDRSFPDVTQHPLSARPFRQFLGGPMEAIVGHELLSQTDAFFSGQGGDHLFLASTSGQRFTDYLRTRGFRADFMEELVASARHSETSIWKVIRTTGRALSGHHPSNPLEVAFDHYKTAVTSVVAARLQPDELVPVWTKDPKGLPPGKFLQVQSLAHMVHFREPLDRSNGRDVVHPLISQPLIELCLRLPTHYLSANGVSRGLARTALEGVIPDKIRRRMTKGGFSRFFVDVLLTNRAQIIGVLCSGELEKRGLIRRPDIESILNQDHHRIKASGRLLLTYYTIEAWLRGWADIQKSSARSFVSLV